MLIMTSKILRLWTYQKHKNVKYLKNKNIFSYNKKIHSLNIKDYKMAKNKMQNYKKASSQSAPLSKNELCHSTLQDFAYF